MSYPLVMTVEDVPEHWDLVQADYEVDEYNEMYSPDNPFGLWLVEIVDGEVLNAYGCFRTVPDLDAILYAVVVDGEPVNEEDNNG